MLEEPHFIKCESVIESSCNLNTEELLSVSVKKIKVEPDLAFTDECGEDHSLGIIKEDLDIQDVKEERDDTGGHSMSLPEVGPADPSQACFKCDHCGRLFSQKRSLSQHMGQHPYKCSIQHELLLNRTLTHTAEKPYWCKSFSHLSTLSRHNLEHTELTPHECSVCNKTFTRSGNLARHMRVHTGEKPYSCTICNKLFSQNSKLSLHLKTHTRDRPFSCSVCSKAFSQRTHLQEHMRLHTGERPYKCKLCERRYSASSSLLYHSRTHIGERPYKCNECGKSFRSSSNLAGHLRTHTGERPYSCTVCRKMFTKKSYLIRHMRSHTGQ